MTAPSKTSVSPADPSPHVAAAHDKISDRRFRLSGDAADCAARPRGGRLFRNRAVQQGGGRLRRNEAEGRDPVRRPGLGARRQRAVGAAVDPHRRRAGAGHLLRRADHGAAARRHRRGRPSPRIRPRRHRDHRHLRAVRRCVGSGWQIRRLDEPWRPRHQDARRLPRRRQGAGLADLDHRRRRPENSTRCSSTPKWRIRPTARS